MKTATFVILCKDSLGAVDTVAMIVSADTSRKQVADKLINRIGHHSRDVLKVQEVEPRIGEDSMDGVMEEFDKICSKLSSGELRTLQDALSMVAQRASHMGATHKERELKESSQEQ